MNRRVPLVAAGATLLVALTGCAGERGAHVVTGAERQRFIRAAETQHLLRELRPLRCGGLSSELAQVRARHTHHRGADAFDAGDCPAAF